MYGYHSGTRGGYYARPLRRAVGWWTVLPLWSIILRTVLTLVIGLGVIFAVEDYLSARGLHSRAASAGLQESLLSLDAIVGDGTIVFGMDDLRAGVHREARGLEAALRQMDGNLHRPLAGPEQTVRLVEGRADAVAAHIQRAGSMVGNALEDGDRALRGYGRDLFKQLERWLLSLRY